MHAYLFSKYLLNFEVIFFYHIEFLKKYFFIFFILGGKAFTTKEYLKDHFDRKHADQRIKSREDGIFECVICQRELKKYENAKKHMELFHPPEEENDDDYDDPLKFEDSKVKEEVNISSPTNQN